MAEVYDLTVIGAGSAGLSAAPFAARLGAKVALVERNLPGGDCLYTGCVPSKTLISCSGLQIAPSSPSTLQSTAPFPRRRPGYRTAAGDKESLPRARRQGEHHNERNDR